MTRALALILAGLLVAAMGLADLSGRAKLNPAMWPAARAAADIAGSSAAVYISLRVVNAALSTAQEIELGASVGAQATMRPLKILEPVDDTVERVASVVFAVAAGASLAVVGLEPVTALGLILLGLGLAASGVGRAAGWSGSERIASRAVRMGAAVGIVVPLVFAAGVAIGDRATAAQWNDAMAELDRVTEEARVVLGDGTELPAAAAADTPRTPGSLFGRFGATLNSAGDGVRSAVQSVERYRDAAATLLSEADVLLDATLVIIGVFALRTVVLPALLLWAAVVLLRRLAEESLS